MCLVPGKRQIQSIMEPHFFRHQSKNTFSDSHYPGYSRWRPAIISMLVLWVCVFSRVPGMGQRVVTLRKEKLDTFGLSVTYREVTEGTGHVGIRHITSMHQGTNGELWMASEQALASFDGFTLRTYLPTYRNREKVRPIEIFPLDERRFLVSYTLVSGWQPHVEAMDIFDAQLRTFSPLPFPEGKEDKWVLSQSLYGLYLAGLRGETYYLNKRNLQWSAGGRFDPMNKDVLFLGRYSAGWVAYYDSWHAISIHSREGVDTIRHCIPVRTHADGSYSPYVYLAQEEGRPLEVVSVDAGSGAVRRFVLDGLKKQYRFNGWEAFYTPESDEIWLYDLEDGILSAYGVATQKRTREFRVGEYVGNRGITSLAVFGNHLFLATDGPRWFWISAYPLVLKNEAPEVGSIRSFFGWGNTLLLGTYTGLYQSAYHPGREVSPPQRMTLGFDSDYKPVVIDFVSGGGNSLWMGLSSRLIKVNKSNPDQVEQYLAPDFVGDIWHIEVLSDTVLLLCTDIGIYLFNARSKKWTKWGIDWRVYGMIPQKDGWWVCYGDRGVCRVKMKDGKLLALEPFMPDLAKVPCLFILPESDQDWWVGTRKGLYRMDPLTGQRKKEDWLSCFKGLDVYALYADKQQHLWASTYDGIFFIDPVHRQTYRFGSGQGLSETEYNRNAHWQFEDGRIIFGSINGFTSFNPALLRIPQRPEQVEPVFFIDNQKKPFPSDSRGVLKLPGGIQSLYVAFRGLQLSTSEDRYAYRIPTLHDDWVIGVGAGIWLDDIPKGRFVLQLYREVEGHWVRIPDVRFVRKAGAATWFTYLSAALFLLSAVLFLWIFLRIVRRKKTHSVQGNGEGSGSIMQVLPGSVLPSKAAQPGGWSGNDPGAPVEEVAMRDSGLRDTQPTDVLIAMAEEILEKHYSDTEFNIASFAAKVAVSERRLFDIIKKHTGKTPNNYILEFRLLKAHQAICGNPYKPLVEVLYESGFSTPSYFSKRFQERFGVLPSMLQKRILKKNNSSDE